MPILKKTTFKQDLERVSVLIKDNEPFSKYFKISKLPDTFTGGKNAFLIQGSPQLVPDTIVKIEIKDALGNPIYNEPAAGIPEYYEGTSKVIAVHVYPDTAFGPATITILGELSHFVDGDLSVPIPADWRDKYNVRWQGTINVHPYAQNTTPIRFYRRPKIEITEEILPIYNRTVETKTETGHINGTSIIPIQDSDYRTFKGSLAYELSTTSSFFSQSMEGFQIDIQGLAKEYKPIITDVTSETKAFVNIPYFITGSGNPLYEQIKNFSNKPFSLDYENQVTLFNSNVSSSFARIKITDLETFTGDAARIKVYASSQNDLGDFQLLEDTILESTELLKVDEFNGSLNVRTGIFSQQILNTFWKTDPINTSVTAEIDNNLLIKSVKLTPTTDINSYTSAKPLFRFYNSGSINFTKFSEYQLDFTPLLSSSLGYGWIEVYGSGSAFISTDRTNDYGKLLTKLETNKPFLKYDKQQVNFQPDQTGTGNILFVIKGGKWQIGNVSLAVAQESSFSPNEITLTVNVPTKINNETFDFKFELYDINNNYVPIDLTAKATFTGGNDVNIRRALDVNTSTNYFNFSTDGNYPSFITIDYFKTGLTGSVTFKSGAVDNVGNEITIADLNPGQDFPGGLEIVDSDTVKLTLEKFTGSLNTNTKFVGSITYTASCEDVNRYFTVFRVDQGAPAYLFYATADKNTFGFNPDDNSNSIILNDYIDIRLVNQNLPDPFGDGFQIISGSTGSKPAPPLLKIEPRIGNADIYRLFISTSRDTTPNNISGYTYEVSQSTYDFRYQTEEKGIFTSSITIDTLLRGTSAKSLIATTDTNQFFYKMNTLEPTTAQTATILVKRQNLGAYDRPISVSKTPSSAAPNLELISSNNGLGVATYRISAGTAAGTTYRQQDGSVKYTFTTTDLNNIQYSDEITLNTVIANSQIAVTATKEAVALAAKSTGDVLADSVANAAGTVQVNVGADAATPTATAGVPNTFTTAIVAGSATGVTSPTVDSATGTYSIGGLTTDSGSVTLAVAYTNGSGVTTTTNKTITYVKTKKAAPVISFAINNKNQTVNAKSSGEQLASSPFTNPTFTIQQTYDGATTPINALNSNATVTATNGYTQYTAGTTGITLQNLPDNIGSSLLQVSGEVTDAEGSIRTVYDTITLSKVNQAAPLINLDVFPTTQTIPTDSLGNAPTVPQPVTINLFEGTTAKALTLVAGPFYTNGLGVNGQGFTANGISFSKTMSEITKDSASFGVTVSTQTSEGLTVQKYISGSIAKAKAAPPVTNISINPQAQTIQKNLGVYGSTTNVTVTVDEGKGNYTYSTNTATKSSFYITAIDPVDAVQTNSNGVLTLAAITTDTGANVTLTISYTNSEGTIVTGKTIKFGVDVALQGVTGATGASGAGLVFRGAYVNETYYNNANRKDVVKYSTNTSMPYWIYIGADATAVSTSPPASGTTANAVWSPFGASFSSVATDLLLANNVAITKALVMGTGTDAGIIRGGHTDYNVGATPGFFLGYSTDAFKFSLGNVAGSKVLFNGTTLFVGDATNGFTVGSKGLYTLSKSTFESYTQAGVYISSDGIALGGGAAGATTSPFQVTSGGALTATGVNVSGNISMGAGSTITGANISVSGTLTASGMTFGTNAGGAGKNGINLSNGDYWYADESFSFGNGIMTYASGTGAVVKIAGWNVGTDAIYSSSRIISQYDTSGTPGITLYNGGSIHAKSFYIDTSGNAFFKGQITSGAGIGGSAGTTGTGFTVGTNSISFGKTSNTDTTNAGFWLDTTNGMYLGAANTNPIPFSVTMAGFLTANSGKVGGWVLSSTELKSATQSGGGDGATTTSGIIIGSGGGGYISGQNFYIKSDGTAYFSGIVPGRNNGTISVGNLDGKIWTDNTGFLFTDVSTTPSVSGLYTGQNRLGFYNSDAGTGPTGWRAYMDKSGNFYLGGSTAPTDTTAKGVAWSSASNTFVISGTLYTAAGTVGGWSIGSTTLTSTNSRTVLNNSGIIQLKDGTSVERILITTNNLTTPASSVSANQNTWSTSTSTSTTQTSFTYAYSWSNTQGESSWQTTGTFIPTAASLNVGISYPAGPSGASPVSGVSKFLWSWSVAPSNFIYAYYTTTVKMVIQLQKSANGGAWTNVGSAITKDIYGETVRSAASSYTFGTYSAGTQAVSYNLTDVASTTIYRFQFYIVSSVASTWYANAFSATVNGFGEATVYGTSASSVTFTYSNLAAKTEIGTNGIQISSEGGLTAIGTIAGGSYGGKFIGDIQVQGTVFAGAFTQASDERVKTDIQDIESPILKLQKLNPKDFLWKDVVEPLKQKGRSYGFIAQEVEKYFPDIVKIAGSITGYDDLKSIEYNSITALNTAVIKELINKIQLLENTITDLENRLENM